MSSDQLLVPIELAPAPYVLADPQFLSTLDAVERQAAALHVSDAESAEVGAKLQIRLTNAGKELERVRQELTAPFLAAQRKIADVARGPANRIEAAKLALKKQLTTYDEDQRWQCAEALRKQQEELGRLEKLRREEEAREILRQKAVDKAAQEAAAQAKAANEAPPLDLDEPPPPVKTETQKAIEAIRYTPVVAASKPAGITFRVSLVAVVVDVNLLPEPFIEKTPKLRAIQATYCSGWKEGQELPVLPGVRFEVKRDAVSTGRT